MFQRKQKIVLGVGLGILVLLVLVGLAIQRVSAPSAPAISAPAQRQEPLFEHNLDEALQAIEVLEELGVE